MASYNIVRDHKNFLTEAIKEYVDIVFANEDEARSLTGKSPEKALNEISQWCDIAIVKLGKDGSLIKQGSNTVKVDGIQAVLKDTTGAGDLYASGFLYGLIHHLDLFTCGNIASLTGGKVVEVYGARMEEHRWEAIKSSIQNIVSGKDHQLNG